MGAHDRAHVIAWELSVKALSRPSEFLEVLSRTYVRPLQVFSTDGV